VKSETFTGHNGLPAHGTTLLVTREPAERSVHFADVLPPSKLRHTFLSLPYSSECSVLISYEDLRAARTSLLEFSKTKTEDSVWFIENTESILGQANNIYSAS
jgi:hypothetical protein